MSDELLEGRSLRGRRPRDYYPPGMIPRFLTPSGELQPITEETIAAIEAALDAHTRGETPPDYTPQYEDPTGAFRPLTDEAFEDLIAYARQHSWRRVPPSRRERRAVGGPMREPLDETLSAEPPTDFIPWFDTVSGELPPIIIPDEEIEVLPEETPEPPPPPPSPPPPAPRPFARRERFGTITQRLLAAVRGEVEAGYPPAPRRWRGGRLILLIGGIGLAILLIFVPLGIGNLPILPIGGRATPTPQQDEHTPSEVSQTPTPIPPAPTASPTLPPYAQGRIAFASNRDGDFEIYVLDMASGVIAQLTDNDHSDRQPTWSPDGERIVFVSDRFGDDDLFVMNADGSGQVQLTTSTAMDHSPAWSPDGRTIIFARETVSGSDLLAFPTACLSEPGACEKALTTITSGRYDLHPTWSPDGSRIAFAASDFPGLPAAIALIDPDGQNYYPLAGTGTSDITPAWSPDGERIAFVSFARGDNDLFVMTPAGEGVTQLTVSTANDVEPAWSPDGRCLIFASDRGAGGDFDLYIMDAACPTPQVCEAHLVPLTEDEGDDLNPAWWGDRELSLPARRMYTSG